MDVIADNLSDEQVKKLRLIDNKTNESEWDYDKLQLEVPELDFSGFDLDFGLISPDEFGEDFELPSGEKSEFVTMSFQLHEKQAEVIKRAMECVADECEETFGNTNSHGNQLYEVIRQWEEQKKL